MGGGITTKIGEYMRLPLFKLILLFFPLKGLRRCRLVSFLFAPCRRLVHLHKDLQVKKNCETPTSNYFGSAR